MPATPEQQAIETIAAILAAAGRAVQDHKAFAPSISTGIALLEVPLTSGRCAYMLLVDRKRFDVVEVKAKTPFMIVDAIGVCGSDNTESRPLERKATVAFKKLHRQFARSFRDKGTLIQVA